MIRKLILIVEKKPQVVEGTKIIEQKAHGPHRSPEKQ